MHCDNKPQQIGLNPDYNMTFLISPHGCQHSPLKRQISCWKREPFRAIPIVMSRDALDDGKLSPHNARRQASDVLRDHLLSACLIANKHIELKGQSGDCVLAEIKWPHC